MKKSPPPCLPLWRGAAACWFALAIGTAQAADGPMDFLFTTGRLPAADAAGNSPRAWKLGEFSALKLAPRETGSQANQHPAPVSVDSLKAALSKLELANPGTRPQALFSEPELAELAPALAQALAAATPSDDILMVSTLRRGLGGVGAQLSVVGRFFMQNNALQLIVQDARADLATQASLTKTVPALNFGSRNVASRMAIQSATAVSRRGDWLAMDLRTAAALGAHPAAAPAATTPASAAASFEAQEQRLRNLKRLHEQGLIKDDEYEQKRKEILRDL